jgi:hypothetical protein
MRDIRRPIRPPELRPQSLDRRNPGHEFRLDDVARLGPRLERRFFCDEPFADRLCLTPHGIAYPSRPFDLPCRQAQFGRHVENMVRSRHAVQLGGFREAPPPPRSSFSAGMPKKGLWKDVAEELGVSPEALYRELAARGKRSPGKRQSVGKFPQIDA